ncbi:uncharacterized protein LOC114352198, partial [Ostrinia furnacalis]|uniref:uncharacterized protein LOC114352198 n=1 Tax=Ostrinia furnacalis TaxID=93504 RepID=UPI00103E73C8
MVRNRKRKTDIGLHNEADMKEAVALVEGGKTLREAANLKNVNFSTLYRYCKKKKENPEEEGQVVRYTPNYKVRTVFTENQEQKLKEYLITCAKMSYGLDTIEARKLAYELASHLNLETPQSWKDRKIAGIDWLYGFRKRNPDLSLRKPEPCSLSRATSFNRHNVMMFFDNLEDVMKRQSTFGNGTRVFALDETGTTTVQKPKKILAQKGSKQLNKVTSGERGTLVTTCCIVSATGTALSPAMVFPRKHFKNFMINKAPIGTLGLAQPTGWMNTQLFAEVMKHFVKITGSSKDNQSLLILDNHESHLSPEALNIAKDNGVTILTIPPHTSHRLQPLDVSVFAPLQTYYNAAADSWMMRNPGVPISIYCVAEILGTAFEKAMTPVNIKSGFRKSGIFPFDRNIFNDDDFMPSEVTNRTDPNEKTMPDAESSRTNNARDQEFDLSRTPSPSLIEETDCNKLQLLRNNDRQTPQKSFAQVQEDDMTENIDLVQIDASKLEKQNNKNVSTAGKHLHGILKSPLECRDYPKAKPRLSSSKGRQRGKTIIATDTPIKKEIEEKALLKEEKKLMKKEKEIEKIIKKKEKKTKQEKPES